MGDIDDFGKWIKISLIFYCASLLNCAIIIFLPDFVPSTYLAPFAKAHSRIRQPSCRSLCLSSHSNFVCPNFECCRNHSFDYFTCFLLGISVLFSVASATAKAIAGSKSPILSRRVVRPKWAWFAQLKCQLYWVVCGQPRTCQLYCATTIVQYNWSCMGHFNPFPNNKFYTLPNSKGSQTTISHFDENSRKSSKQVENTVAKGEIACYKQFLLFPHCFQKTCTADT